MAINRRKPESVYGIALGDLRDMVKVKLLESQQPSGLRHTPSEARLLRRCRNRAEDHWPSKTFLLQAVVNETTKVVSGTPKSC